MSTRARVGILGAGWWAALNHIPVIQAHPDATLAAVGRLGESELQALLTKFGIPYGSQDAAKLLAEVPLDGVIVASPHTLHAEHALLALAAGCHVMVEKPAATTAGDAHSIQSEATRRGLGLMVPHAWNYKSYALTARN